MVVYGQVLTSHDRNVEDTSVKDLARLFKALSDETRLKLVVSLVEKGTDGALCVGALASRLGVTQSAVSQHLAVLRAADLVIDERRGYFVHYRLNYGNPIVGELMETALGKRLAGLAGR
jgi:ArsR family transcriptional regulator, arsenate/arsenite/antimonite-responsive transcriptional repressor